MGPIHCYIPSYATAMVDSKCDPSKVSKKKDKTTWIEKWISFCLVGDVKDKIGVFWNDRLDSFESVPYYILLFVPAECVLS